MVRHRRDELLYRNIERLTDSQQRNDGDWAAGLHHLPMAHAEAVRDHVLLAELSGEPQSPDFVAETAKEAVVVNGDFSAGPPRFPRWWKTSKNTTSKSAYCMLEWLRGTVMKADLMPLLAALTLLADASFAQTAASHPPQHAQEPATLEAAAKMFWDTALVRCGDDYFYRTEEFSWDELHQFRKVTFKVVPFSVTEADNLNGIRYHGVALLIARAARSKNVIAVRPPDANPPRSYGDFRPRLEPLDKWTRPRNSPHH
jgi:hypothetical protein